MNERANRLGGPVPKFNDYHIWKALESLDVTVPVGRKRLSQVLGIGEGSTRTILSQLQAEGMITIGKSGIVLTERGTAFKETYHMDVADVSISDLTIGDKDCAVRVAKRAKDVRFGCEERDAAIKSGATGATTLIYQDGCLLFPGSDYPVEEEIASKVRSLFTLRNDDVVIIGTGPTSAVAEIGAVIAGLTIMGGLRFNHDLADRVEPKNPGIELISLAFAIHDLVGGLPVCAKSRDNLGIRIENGAVIDNAYTGAVLEEVINEGTTIRRIASSGPYKGIRVIVTPIEWDNSVIAAIGVVDIRTMAGVNNLIRLGSDDNDRGMQDMRRRGRLQDEDAHNRQGQRHGPRRDRHQERLPERPEDVLEARAHEPVRGGRGGLQRVHRVQAGQRGHPSHRLPGARGDHQGPGGRRRPGSQEGLHHPLRGGWRGGPHQPRAEAFLPADQGRE